MINILFSPQGITCRAGGAGKKGRREFDPCTFKEGFAEYFLEFSNFFPSKFLKCAHLVQSKSKKTQKKPKTPKTPSPILLKNTVFCTQTFIALRTLKNDSLKCLKCVWTWYNTCIYTHRYAYAQAMYIYTYKHVVS